MRAIVTGAVIVAVLFTMRPGTAAAQQPRLEVSLSLERELVMQGEPLMFTVSIRNPTNELVTAQFATAQRFDVVMASSAGELTRWSTGRVFAQLFRQESWLPGETIAHTDAWLPVAPFNPTVLGVGFLPPIPPGIYRVWAELPVLGRPVVSAAQRVIVSRPLQLSAGCTAFVSGLPGGDWLPLLPTLIQPYSALASVWRYDSASGAYSAFSPDADTRSDLVIVLANDLIMFCMKDEAQIHLPW